MIANEITQTPETYHKEIVRTEKPEKANSLKTSNMKIGASKVISQEVMAYILSLTMFFTSGATVAGGFAALLFDGWKVITVAVLGGLWGMFIVALFHGASSESYGGDI